MHDNIKNSAYFQEKVVRKSKVHFKEKENTFVY